METHVVPVGFDYDRLIAPLVRDKVDVNRAVLLRADRGEEEVARKLAEDFSSLLDAETRTVEIDDVYDYDGLFALAHDVLLEESSDGGNVRINVSAMPRTVSFAFFAAAQGVVVEHDGPRGGISAYYTAPERYLEREFADELERTVRLMRRLKDEGLTDSVERALDDRYASATDLVREYEERGTTAGARDFDGSHTVEIPLVPPEGVKEFEATLLRVLDDEGVVDSVSELADRVADATGRDNTDSFRSKVIYDVRSLRDKGYVRQEEHGKSHRTGLSHAGRLWVRAHGDTDDAPDGL